MERYAAALGANFTWQIVNDKGRPVSKDFTWAADVAYRNSSPALATANNMADAATSAESAPSKPKDEKQQTKEMQPETQNQPLEEAIARASWQPGAVAEIARQLSETTIFVLGRRSGRAASSGAYSNTELVRETFDLHGQRVYGLPVFTRLKLVIPALVRNPSWLSYSVLQIHGREVLENVPSDVAIVINPETEPNFHIPQRNDRSLAYTAEPVVPAANLVPA